jgi:mRNA interferase HigB
MRLISLKTLRDFWEKHPDAQGPLSAWQAEVKAACWTKSTDIKERYASASIINNKRVVFNIGGNKYRLVVDVEYERQLIFVVRPLTHKEYDGINVETLTYEAR